MKASRLGENLVVAELGERRGDVDVRTILGVPSRETAETRSQGGREDMGERAYMRSISSRVRPAVCEEVSFGTASVRVCILPRGRIAK